MTRTGVDQGLRNQPQLLERAAVGAQRRLIRRHDAVDIVRTERRMLQ